MVRGKKDKEVKAETEKKNKVLERLLRESLQKLDPAKPPAEKKLIDKPKGQGDGKK